MRVMQFQAVLTLVVLIGGGYVATRNEQPIEIRLAASTLAGGAVAYWFKSPLQ
jgi:hypothetical protein